MSQSDIPHRTLWLSVWDFDRFGKNQFLGEVRLPLSSVDLNDPAPRWHTLQDKVLCNDTECAGVCEMLVGGMCAGECADVCEMLVGGVCW